MVAEVEMAPIGVQPRYRVIGESSRASVPLPLIFGADDLVVVKSAVLCQSTAGGNSWSDFQALLNANDGQYA